MDLLALLKREIDSLGLTDKLKIAQYIYKRTGDLFEYDPLWVFSSVKEREKLRNKRLDITNITDFDITCFSWSNLYNELLHAFNIVSRVKYVEEDVYQKNESVEGLIEKLKLELEELKIKCGSKEQYVYHVYQKIGELINVLKVKTGYVIGIKYVQALLKVFLGNEHLMQNIYFYNKEKSVYIAIHQVTVDRTTHYFAYEKKSEGIYEMHEVTPATVELYYGMYSYKLSKDLKQILIPSLKL